MSTATTELPKRFAPLRSPPYAPTIGDASGTYMSISPFVPNRDSRAPVAALSAINRRPAATRIRAGRLPSPGQNATPRREGAPPVTTYRQRSCPVCGSSATTRLAAGTYIVPLTTIGVASEFGPPVPRPVDGASLCRPYVHTDRSLATLPALTCASGDHPVP